MADQQSATPDPYTDHARPTPARGTGDPLESRIAFLSLAQLEWLADQGHFHPGPASPLAFLRLPLRRTSEARRTRAGGTLMESDPWYPHRRLDCQRLAITPLGHALRILESPTARLRLAVSRPGRAPDVRQIFVRGSLAVAAFVDPEGLRIGEPFRTATLASYLLEQVASPDLPGELEARCLVPEVFELATTLWRRLERDADEPITRSEVKALLGSRPDLDDEASDLLTAMTAARLLEGAGEHLAGDEAPLWLHTELRPWLRLVWSGHVVELERRSLADGEGCEEDEDAAVERLLFAGPHGQRILCEDLPDPAGLPVLLFSRPTLVELSQRLWHFLRGAPAGDLPRAGERQAQGAAGFAWAAGAEVN